MHVVANHTAAIDGEVADAETYVVAYLRRIDGTTVDVVGGRYIDRFEKRDGDWRIARRVYVCEWSAALPTAGALVDAGAYVPGRRDRTDPSYTGMMSEIGVRTNG
jgi:hypothetical protein